MGKSNTNHGFTSLLSSMMQKRWFLSLLVLLTFFSAFIGISLAIKTNTGITEPWKELILLMLGAFLTSYGKVIDYWFSDREKDRMFAQKMDEEDGLALSKVNITDDTGGAKEEPIIIEHVVELPKEEKKEEEIQEEEKKEESDEEDKK